MDKKNWVGLAGSSPRHGAGRANLVRFPWSRDIPPYPHGLTIDKSGYIPLELGALLGLAGDSIDEFNFNAGANLSQRQSGLIINSAASGEVINALAVDPRASFLAWNDTSDSVGLLTNTGRYYSGGDVGRAGGSLDDIIAEIPRLAAYKPDLVILNGGTNSLNLVALGTFGSKHLAIIDRIHELLPKAKIGVGTVRATGPSQVATRTPSMIAGANALIKANVEARSQFCELLDYSAYADDTAHPGQSLSINFQTGPYQASPQGDDLHPGPYGAQQKCDPIIDFVRRHVKPGNAIKLRKVGSALPIGMGTNAGSVAVNHTSTNGGVISGFVPTSMDVAFGGQNFSSCVCSLVPNLETGGQTLVLTITLAGTATTETFAIRPSAIAIATTALQSKWARMWAKIEVGQEPGLLQMTMQSAERSNAVNNNQNANIGIYPKGSGKRVLYPVTPHLQYPSGSTGLNTSIVFKVNPSAAPGGQIVIKLHEWDVQIEESPVRP